LLRRIARDELLYRRLRHWNCQPRIPGVGRAHAAELSLLRRWRGCCGFLRAQSHPRRAEKLALGGLVGVERLGFDDRLVLNRDLRRAATRAPIEDEADESAQHHAGGDAIQHEVSDQRTETDLRVYGE